MSNCLIEHIPTNQLLANPAFDSSGNPRLTHNDHALNGKYVEDQLKAETQTAFLGAEYRVLVLKDGNSKVQKL